MGSCMGKSRAKSSISPSPPPPSSSKEYCFVQDKVVISSSSPPDSKSPPPSSSPPPPPSSVSTSASSLSSSSSSSSSSSCCTSTSTATSSSVSSLSSSSSASTFSSCSSATSSVSKDSSFSKDRFRTGGNNKKNPQHTVPRGNVNSENRLTPKFSTRKGEPQAKSSLKLQKRAPCPRSASSSPIVSRQKSFRREHSPVSVESRIQVPNRGITNSLHNPPRSYSSSPLRRANGSGTCMRASTNNSRKETKNHEEYYGTNKSNPVVPLRYSSPSRNKENFPLQPANREELSHKSNAARFIRYASPSRNKENFPVQPAYQYKRNKDSSVSKKKQISATTHHIYPEADDDDDDADNPEKQCNLNSEVASSIGDDINNPHISLDCFIFL